MDGGETIKAYMVCADGFNQVFCLVDGFLWELERIEIPGWLDKFDEKISIPVTDM